MKEAEKADNHYFTVAKLCIQVNVRQLYDRLMLRANQGDKELAAFLDTNTAVELAPGIGRSTQLRAYVKKTLGLGKSSKELAELLDRATVGSCPRPRLRRSHPPACQSPWPVSRSFPWSNHLANAVQAPPYWHRPHRGGPATS